MGEGKGVRTELQQHLMNRRNALGLWKGCEVHINKAGGTQIV